MTARTTAVTRYDFINPQTLSALFVERSTGSVTQNEDHVRIADNGLLAFNLTAGPGVGSALLKSAEFVVRAGGTVPISAKAFIGLANAPGADQDYANITDMVGFLVPGAAGGGALSVQAITSSPAVDSTALAVGLNLLESWQRFRINLTENVVTKGPPLASAGGRANCKMSVDNAQGYRREVSVSTALDITGYAGRLQPVIMLSGATFDLDVREICLEYSVT